MSQIQIQRIKQFTEPSNSSSQLFIFSFIFPSKSLFLFSFSVCMRQRFSQYKWEKVRLFMFVRNFSYEIFFQANYIFHINFKEYVKIFSIIKQVFLLCWYYFEKRTSYKIKLLPSALGSYYIQPEKIMILILIFQEQDNGYKQMKKYTGFPT